MKLPEILIAVAERLRTVDGLREVQYPAKSAVTKYPTAILFSGSPDTDLAITHGVGDQMWIGDLYAQVLIARLGEADKEIAQIDALIFPIVDAFSVNSEGYNPILPGLTGHIDRCHITRVRPNRLIGYAGQNYAGLELFFSVKWKRTAA